MKQSIKLLCLFKFTNSQASGWGLPTMEPKLLPSPVRRSATPEQPANKSASGNHTESSQTTSNSSPANKKQRGAGEGDGPLNLSKPKGTHIRAHNLINRTFRNGKDENFWMTSGPLIMISFVHLFIAGQGGSPTPPSTPSSTPTPLTSTASLTSSRMFPGQNHMLPGSGLLFPGHFLPYPAMPPHLTAMNFTGKIQKNESLQIVILIEARQMSLEMFINLYSFTSELN